MPTKIGLGVLFLIAALLSWRAFGPSFGGAGRERAVEVTYICTETKEVVKGPAEPVPALNPKTGRRTLVRAVYALRTKSWVPAPPEEVLRKNQHLYSTRGGPSPLAFAPPEGEQKKP